MMSSSSRKPRSPFAGHQREPDPLASPCICGFRKKCGKELLEKHFLSAVDLHGDSYRSQCWKMFANKSKLSKKESAVDHIIELHQVKTAFHRASTWLENWNSPEEWLQIVWDKISGHADLQNLLGKPTIRENVTKRMEFLQTLWWPQSNRDTLNTLSDLQWIFNHEKNLCLIEEEFNRKKYSFLSNPSKTGADAIGTENKKKTTGGKTVAEAIIEEETGSNSINSPTKPTLRKLLQAYYLATSDMRDFVLNDLLLTAFWETGNLMFWAVRRILRENQRDFDDECGPAQRINGYDIRDAYISDEYFADDPYEMPQPRKSAIIDQSLAFISDEEPIDPIATPTWALQLGFKRVEGENLLRRELRGFNSFHSYRSEPSVKLEAKPLQSQGPLHMRTFQPSHPEMMPSKPLFNISSFPYQSSGSYTQASNEPFPSVEFSMHEDLNLASHAAFPSYPRGQGQMKAPDKRKDKKPLENNLLGDNCPKYQNANNSNTRMRNRLTSDLDLYDNATKKHQPAEARNMSDESVIRFDDDEVFH